MLDDPMPGAALEAPDTFQRLAAPLWPHLPLAVGYSGGARWVAVYLALDKQGVEPCAKYVSDLLHRLR